jgi:hypothetical protein
VLNSGIYDNRTLIGEMPRDEEWVLDCEVVDEKGKPLEYSPLSFSLGEYLYDVDNGIYRERRG